MATDKYADFYMKTDLDISSCSEVSDSEDEDFAPEETKVPVTTTKVQSIKRNGEERQPTRRPDPNVSNRNALKARENRFRKKQQLETLQTDVDNLKKQKICMKKTIKTQSKYIRKLEKSNSHLKSLLNNQPEIVKFLDKFNCTVNPSAASLSSSSIGSSSPMASVDFNDNGLITDYGTYDTTDDYNLFGGSSILPSSPTTDYYSSDGGQSITEEHNYTNTCTTPGFCVHIGQRGVSIEYCPSCCSTDNHHNTNEVV